MRKGGKRKLKVRNLECEFGDVVESIKVWSREGWDEFLEKREGVEVKTNL
jgi:hypothetical protein